MQSEIAVLQSLVRDPLNYEKAFGCINKTMRMMFIHAVQSLLWNQCATYRIDTYGLQVVVGDLVLAPMTVEHNMHVENSNSYEKHQEGCPEVKVVTESDVIEKRYTLEDIVLPLFGVKTRNPDNAVGTYMNSLLTEQHHIRIEMIEQMMKQRDFHCAGDYRKVICRPTNVQYEIIEYMDELQPFIQTDFMKLKGIDVPHRCSNYNDSLLQYTATGTITTTPDGTLEAETNEMPLNDTNAPPLSINHRLIGMTISFTLPSSAYATICLRELMKRPTCSEYQRELQLGNNDNE
jgi:tRNA pseudouridine13 synthase